MWAWRRIPLLSPHRPPPPPRAASGCHASPSSKPLNAICKDFLPWLRKKSGQDISTSLSIGNSGYGRSLFASKFIEAGEYIMEVPFDVHLTSDRALPEIKTIIHRDAGVSNIGKLATVLLSEMKLSESSDWAPYVNVLPFCEQMHNTIFWSEEELQMLQKSPVYHETLSLKSRIEAEFAVIIPALRKLPHIFGDCSLEDFVRAYTIVGSRAWDTTEGISLIPFADFLNHDGASDSVLLSDEDKKNSVVIADRNYASGEQVLIRYGKFSNATLMLEFGFTLPYNIHDQVEIWFDVPAGDPLHTEKVKILYEYKMMANSNAHTSSSGSSFTVKEVRSANGNGRGIPQALRAFCRVICASSVEELKAMAMEAVEGDGRLARCPSKSKDSEIKAHYILLSHITRLIDDYSTSIKSLEPMNSSSKSSRFSIRRRMAMDLLSGELRVLKSAHSWLRNYCNDLST